MILLLSAEIINPHITNDYHKFLANNGTMTCILVKSLTEQELNRTLVLFDFIKSTLIHKDKKSQTSKPNIHYTAQENSKQIYQKTFMD